MGDRGHNAGGYAWMKWVVCTKCGCKFIIGKGNERRTCTSEAACAKRRLKKGLK